MSTKIFNGYKIKSLSMLEFNSFIEELRTIMRTIFQEQYDKVFAMECAYLVNELVILDDKFKETGNKEDLEKFLTNLYCKSNQSIPYLVKKMYGNNGIEPISMNEIVESLNYQYLGSPAYLTRDKIANRTTVSNITQMRDNLYEYHADLCVFPFEDKILLLAYGNLFDSTLSEICSSRKKIYKEFRMKYNLEYYGYWNNTDKPKNLSKKEWKQRCLDWEIALPGCAVPVSSSISINLWDSDVFFTELEVKAFSQKFKKNKYFLDKNIYVKEYALIEVKHNFILDYYEKNKKSEKDNKVGLMTDAAILFKELLEKNDETILSEVLKLEKKYQEILPEINVDILIHSITSLIPNYMNTIQNE